MVGGGPGKKGRACTGLSAGRGRAWYVGETGRDRVLQVRWRPLSGDPGEEGPGPLRVLGGWAMPPQYPLDSDPGVSRRGSGVSQDGARDTSGWDQGVEPAEGEKVVGPGALHSEDTAVLCGWSEVL